MPVEWQKEQQRRTNPRTSIHSQNDLKVMLIKLTKTEVLTEADCK